MGARGVMGPDTCIISSSNVRWKLRCCNSFFINITAILSSLLAFATNLYEIESKVIYEFGNKGIVGRRLKEHVF